MERDAALRTELETAERLGISRKRFLGWEPVTTYTYDGDRLATSRHEVEWDEVEQAWMLALDYYRKSLCPTCGLPLSECSSAGSEGRYTVDPPTRCHRTTAVLRAQEDLLKGAGAPKYPQALSFYAHRS